MAHVVASPAWSRPHSAQLHSVRSHSAQPYPALAQPARTAMPWVWLGRIAAGVAQVLGLVGVLWLLAALPGLVSARDSTVGPAHGRRPAAMMVARR